MYSLTMYDCYKIKSIAHSMIIVSLEEYPHKKKYTFYIMKIVIGVSLISQLTSYVFMCAYEQICIDGVASVTSFFFDHTSNPYAYQCNIVWDQSACSFSFFYPFFPLFFSFSVIISSSLLKKSVAKMSSRVQSWVHEGRRFQDTMRIVVMRSDAMQRDTTRCDARRDTFLVAPP